MGRTGVHVYGVRGSRIERASISVNNADVRHMREVGGCTRRQVVVSFNCGNAAPFAHRFREYRRVVAGTATDVDDVITWLRVEGVHPARVPARLAVVEHATGVNRDEDVAVEMKWAGIPGLRVDKAEW